MNVLLLEEEEQNDKYKKCFEDNGFDNITFIPVLDFEYYNLNQLKLFGQNFDQYSGLIFTSKRAIHAFELGVDQSTIDLISQAEKFKIYVVGRSSEICAKKLGLHSIGSDTGNAIELSEFIINDDENRSSKPLMFVCGNLDRETIPMRLDEKGILYETISCYKTIPDQNFVSNLKSYYDIIYDVIVFFSPSGAEFYLSEIKKTVKDFNTAKIVAIGEYTAKSLIKLNTNVDGIAKKPTPESLFKAIYYIFD